MKNTKTLTKTLLLTIALSSATAIYADDEISPRDAMRANMQSMSFEERQIARENMHATLDAMSEEEREAFMETMGASDEDKMRHRKGGEKNHNHGYGKGYKNRNH
jgi:hypothetical protein